LTDVVWEEVAPTLDELAESVTQKKSSEIRPSQNSAEIHPSPAQVPPLSQGPVVTAKPAPVSKSTPRGINATPTGSNSAVPHQSLSHQSLNRHHQSSNHKSHTPTPRGPPSETSMTSSRSSVVASPILFGSGPVVLRPMPLRSASGQTRHPQGTVVSRTQRGGRRTMEATGKMERLERSGLPSIRSGVDLARPLSAQVARAERPWQHGMLGATPSVATGNPYHSRAGLPRLGSATRQSRHSGTAAAQPQRQKIGPAAGNPPRLKTAGPAANGNGSNAQRLSTAPSHPLRQSIRASASAVSAYGGTGRPTSTRSGNTQGDRSRWSVNGRDGAMRHGLQETSTGKRVGGFSSSLAKQDSQERISSPAAKVTPMVAGNGVASKAKDRPRSARGEEVSASTAEGGVEWPWMRRGDDAARPPTRGGTAGGPSARPPSQSGSMRPMSRAGEARPMSRAGEVRPATRGSVLGTTSEAMSMEHWHPDHAVPRGRPGTRSGPLEATPAGTESSRPRTRGSGAAAAVVLRQAANPAPGAIGPRPATRAAPEVEKFVDWGFDVAADPDDENTDILGFDDGKQGCSLNRPRP